MVFEQKRYFKDFLNAGEGIASNILTDRLGKLESAGILNKRADPANRRQVIYSLTEKGMALIPLLVELVYWGAVCDGATDVTPGLVRKMAENPDRYKRDLAKSLEKRLRTG